MVTLEFNLISFRRQYVSVFVGGREWAHYLENIFVYIDLNMYRIIYIKKWSELDFSKCSHDLNCLAVCNWDSMQDEIVMLNLVSKNFIILSQFR